MCLHNNEEPRRDTRGPTSRSPGSAWRRDPDDQQRELAAAATRLVQTHGPTDYLTTRKRERTSTRQVVTFGVFGPPHAVACVTDFPPQLHTRDGKAVILAAGKKITVPADTLPALRPLLSGQPADIHEITTTTGIDTGALADALIAEGICAEVTPDLAEGYADMLTPTSASASQTR